MYEPAKPNSRWFHGRASSLCFPSPLAHVRMRTPDAAPSPAPNKDMVERPKTKPLAPPFYVGYRTSVLIKLVLSDHSCTGLTRSPQDEIARRGMISERLLALETRLDAVFDELNVLRVKRSMAEKQVLTYVLRQVSTDYYSQTLTQRAALLGASSISHLCKTIVLENTAKEESGSLFDSSDPKYVAVVVQYEAKIDDGALADKIHALALKAGTERLPRKRFKFQLAAEDVSDRLTGFIHNAVTPFGMKAPIPVIVCQRVLDVKPPFIYLGGGAVDMKLGISLSDLVSSTGAVSIGYISRPRSGADDEDNEE